MDPDKSRDITTLLTQLNQGEGERNKAADELMPLVYDELRRLADRYFRGERNDHTLQPTALVHEAYLKLVDQTKINWQSRAHFYAVCARMMRRILIDHARGRARKRRGGGQKPIELEDMHAAKEMPPEDFLALHDAIEKLTKLDRREADVVELRCFGGLNMEEIAEVLQVSKRSVEGDWAHAKAWLQAELADGPRA